MPQILAGLESFVQLKNGLRSGQIVRATFQTFRATGKSFGQVFKPSGQRANRSDKLQTFRATGKLFGQQANRLQRKISTDLGQTHLKCVWLLQKFIITSGRKKVASVTESENQSLWSMLLDNTKVVAMWVLGIILVGLLSWPLAAAYLGYCILSTLLYMALICPYCMHYQTGCPSGYHLIVSKFFKPKEGKSFAQQFGRYIVVMLPVWLIPPAVGVYLIATQPSWAAGVLTVLFCLVAFVVLPYVSKQVTCKKCKNAEYCPWRQSKLKPQSP